MTDATIDPNLSVLRPGVSDAEIEATAAKAALRRRELVIALRVGLLALLLAGWELSARLNWIDPFFFAMPTAIVERLIEWIRDGTSEGPLWLHLWVTMEEALIGFFTGSIAGIVIGVALGRNRLA